MEGSHMEEEGKGEEAKEVRTRSASRSMVDDNRKQALERLGVFVPKSKEENEMNALKSKVTELTNTLERERAKRFHDEQEWKRRQEKHGESANSELASLSRKIHEERVKNKTEMDNIRGTITKEFMDQIAKHRGPVYEKLQEEMSASLQSQINAGKGELFERVMIGARSAVLKECVEKKSGSTYNAVRESINAGIKEDFSLRRGDLYETISRDIRGAVLAEVEEEQEKERQRVLGVERELFTKYRDSVDEMREKLQEQHATLRRELEGHMEKQSSAFLDSYAAQVDRITEEWSKKFSAREQSWLEDLAQAESTRHQERKVLVEEIQAASSAAVSKVTEICQAESAATLEQLSSHLAELKNMEEKQSATRQTLASDLHEASTTAVSKMTEICQAESKATLEQFSSHLEELKVMEEKQSTERQTLASQVQEASSAAVSKMTEICEVESKATLEQFTNHLQQLESMEEKHAENLKTSLNEGVQRLERCLQALKEARELDHEADEKRHAQQLDALEKLMLQEKEAYERSLASMQEFHEQERANFRRLAEEEQRRAAAEKAHSVQELKDEYAVLMASIAEQRKLEAERLSQREVELTDREHALEQTTLKIQGDATVAAESAANERWEQVLASRQKAWKEEEEQRRNEQTSRLEKRHSVVVEQMEASLRALQELREFEENRWAEKQAEYERKSRVREDQFKKVCTAVFEKRMDKFQEECHAKVAEMHEAILRQAAQHAEIRCQLELRVQQVKGQAEADTQRRLEELQAQHRGNLCDMEKRHTDELCGLARQLEQVSQERSTLQELHQQGVHEVLKNRIADTHALRELRASLADRESRLAVGQKQLCQHRERILELWSTLRLESCEYVPFLLGVFERCAFSPEMQAFYEKHIAMLSAKIPLVKLAAERETLKHQVQSIGVDQVNQQIRLERDVVLVRLDSCTRKLQSAIKQFTDNFPHEKFMYQNVDYCRLLEQETRDFSIVDAVLVPGTLARENDVEFEV